MWTSEHQQKNLAVDILFYERKITGQSELCAELNPEKWSRDVEAVCVFGNEELPEAAGNMCYMCKNSKKKKEKSKKKKNKKRRTRKKNLIRLTNTNK